MSDKLNETFQRHLSLLKNKLYEQGTIQQPTDDIVNEISPELLKRAAAKAGERGDPKGDKQKEKFLKGVEDKLNYDATPDIKVHAANEQLLNKYGVVVEKVTAIDNDPKKGFILKIKKGKFPFRHEWRQVRQVIKNNNPFGSYTGQIKVTPYYSGDPLEERRQDDETEVVWRSDLFHVESDYIQFDFSKKIGKRLTLVNPKVIGPSKDAMVDLNHPRYKHYDYDPRIPGKLQYLFLDKNDAKKLADLINIEFKGQLDKPVRPSDFPLITRTYYVFTDTRHGLEKMYDSSVPQSPWSSHKIHSW
jgi:hypothetical protein